MSMTPAEAPTTGTLTLDRRGRLIQTRCTACGCHVTSTHVPGSDHCQTMRSEREWSQRF